MREGSHTRTEIWGKDNKSGPKYLYRAKSQPISLVILGEQGKGVSVAVWTRPRDGSLHSTGSYLEKYEKKMRRQIPFTSCLFWSALWAQVSTSCPAHFKHGHLLLALCPSIQGQFLPLPRVLCTLGEISPLTYPPNPLIIMFLWPLHSFFTLWAFPSLLHQL